MARRYYDTPQRVFQLFKNHPALSQMYSEFGIGVDGIKRVAEFLILNHDKVVEYNLQNIYKTNTPDTLETDQKNPIRGTVTSFEELPTLELEQGDIYYVENPYPGKYFYWNGIEWKEDPKSRDKSRIKYINQLYQEKGFKVWEHESGIFVAMEDVGGSITWEQVQDAVPDYTVIRKSQLPSNPNPGDIYEVLGEDLIDIIASLYGLVDMGMTPPWSNYISSMQTNLQELLNMTIYLYRYGVTDNFYEKHIWDFIPEYDRDMMIEKPKIKLFMESIGRKLDQLEDKLVRLQDVYNIDEIPDEMLDHIGHMLGYEKEDFSLSSVSFRELLKNIIEIYKIKGTNYSFSFFFKFLGFNVNLKEFYFNRDVKNPEAFPGMDVENVEYYLTTTNPVRETYWGSPASHLDSIRSLNDWQVEYDSLRANGCNNIIPYMLGKETHNNDGLKWHSNPWKYFKTNLIEYELNPFFDKVNLTSSDNETIRKYIKFLSPTYLFTWINVNLLPWIEDINIQENMNDYLFIELTKTLGDMRSDGYRDYEDLEEAFQVWDEKHNKLVPYTEADTMFTEIINNLNLGGDDRIGTELRRDGVYIRQPGHPSHITNVFHDGTLKLGFDNLGIMLKPFGFIDYDDYYQNVSDLPQNEQEYTVAFVEETGLYYIYSDPAPFWQLIEDPNEIPPSISPDRVFKTYNDLQRKVAATPLEGVVYKIEGEQLEESYFYTYESQPSPHWNLIQDFDETTQVVPRERVFDSYYDLLLITPPIISTIYMVEETNRYYRYIDESAYWKQAVEPEDRYFKWQDYSYRPFPSYPMSVKPSSGTVLNVNEIDFVWDVVYEEQGYWIQISRDRNFQNIKHEEFIYDGRNNISNKILDNDNYFWRIRTRNKISTLVFTQDEMSDIERISENSSFSSNYFTFDGTNYIIIDSLTGQELDECIEILSSVGQRFHWNSWSSIYRFEIDALPFPRNGQVINDINYQFIQPSRNEITDELYGVSFLMRWKEENNVESYVLEIAKNPDMTNVYYINNTTNNYLRVIVERGTYYWRYKANKKNQQTNWSEIFQFMIDI